MTNLTAEQQNQVWKIEKSLLMGSEFLNALKLPFMLVGGTLLGIIRDGHVLAHDKDVDVAVLVEDMNEDIRKSLTTADGFIHESKAMEPFGQFAYDFDGVHFDIFPLNKKNGYRFYNQERNMCLVWPEHLFKKKNWAKITYLDREWNTPTDPVEFIEYMYGKDWRTPVYVYSWKDAPNFRLWEDIK